MKAVVQDRYGSPDVLEVKDVPEPVPADNQVLVRVYAAAVKAYDWHVMRGDRTSRAADSVTTSSSTWWATTR